MSDINLPTPVTWDRIVEMVSDTGHPFVNLAEVGGPERKLRYELDVATVLVSGNNPNVLKLIGYINADPISEDQLDAWHKYLNALNARFSNPRRYLYPTSEEDEYLVGANMSMPINEGATDEQLREFFMQAFDLITAFFQKLFDDFSDSSESKEDTK